MTCTRCNRPLQRPVWVRGRAYGSTCAGIVGGPKPKRRRVVVAGDAGEFDPRQMALQLEVRA